MANERVLDATVLERRDAIETTLAKLPSLPIVGPLLTDDDLYDEDGLPK